MITFKVPWTINLEASGQALKDYVYVCRERETIRRKYTIR
jgi:hypothetical protein